MSLNKQPPHKITIETSCMKCCKHHSDIVYEVMGITIQDCICIKKRRLKLEIYKIIKQNKYILTC